MVVRLGRKVCGNIVGTYVGDTLGTSLESSMSFHAKSFVG